MHRAFQAYDILYEIFRLLDDPSLARLACTCKSFFGPATLALWSELPGFKPLTLALPSAVLNVYCRLDKYDSSQTGSAALIRFKWYCGVVRRIISRPQDDIASLIEGSHGSRLLRAISPISIERTLFPSLQKLDTRSLSVEHYTAVQAMFSSSVTELTASLDFDISDDQAAMHLETITRSCQDLELLDFLCPHLHNLDGLRNTRLHTLSLSIPFIADDGLEILAGLTTIRKLKLVLECDDPHWDGHALPLATLPRPHGQTGFERLTEFIYESNSTIHACVGVLSRMTANSLRDLRIDAECHSLHLFKICVAAIKQNCTALQGLSWHARARLSDFQNKVQNWDTLAPLADCHNLFSFQFSASSCNAFFVWSNTDIANMAHAWPALKRLRLVTYVDTYEYFIPDHKPLVTLEGLLILSQKCKSLELAQLEFDVDDVPNLPETMIPSSALRSLCAAWCRVADGKYEAAAAYINKIWPSVEVGWGHWFGGQIDDPNDGSEEIINRFAEQEDAAYERALETAGLLAEKVTQLRRKSGAGLQPTSSAHPVLQEETINEFAEQQDAAAEEAQETADLLAEDISVWRGTSQAALQPAPSAHHELPETLTLPHPDSDAYSGRRCSSTSQPRSMPRGNEHLDFLHTLRPFFAWTLNAP